MYICFPWRTRRARVCADTTRFREQRGMQLKHASTRRPGGATLKFWVATPTPGGECDLYSGGLDHSVGKPMLELLKNWKSCEHITGDTFQNSKDSET